MALLLPTQKQMDDYLNRPKIDEAKLFKRVTPDFEKYILYKRIGKDKHCYCTNCGKSYVLTPISRTRRAEDDLRYHTEHHECTTCPHCGAVATAIAVGKIRNWDNHRERRNYVIPKFRRNTIWLNVVTITRYYGRVAYYLKNGLNPTDICTFTIHADSEYKLQPGIAVKYKHCSKFYSGEKYLRIDDKFSEPFYVNACYPWYGGGYEGYTILDKPKLMNNPIVKYSQMETYEQYLPRRWVTPYMPYLKYLATYVNNPAVEIAVKLEYRAVVELLMNGKSNKRLFDWQAKTPAEWLKMSNYDFKVFRKSLGCEDLMNVLKVIKKVRRIDKKASMQYAMQFSSIYADKFDALVKMKELSGKTLQQCLNYLNSQTELRNINNALQYWKDYISMIQRMNYDLTVVRVVLPDDLREAHDKASENLDVFKVKKYKEKCKELDITRRTKYEYYGEKFLIRLPLAPEEIVAEGKFLQHCVGGYVERHCKGKTTILFLRKINEPNTPFYTIEIHGNKIDQVHGYRNDVETGHKPLPEVSEFIAKWNEWLKAGSPKKRKSRKATA